METNNINIQVHDHLVFNQQHDLTINVSSTFNTQSVDPINKNQKKKSRGNRRLQRCRRKLRKQSLNSDAIASSNMSFSSITTSTPMNNELKNSMEIKTEKIETNTFDVMNKPLIHRAKVAMKKQKLNQQQKKILQKKLNREEKIHTNELNTLITSELIKSTATTTDKSMDFANIPDEIFYEILSKAFGNNTSELDNYFSDEKDKIEFVRHYTGLMSRLSYVKLTQQQWDYYYHIGMTQNIWKGRIPKCQAEKNSLCYTYGRSKRIIQQRRAQIQNQLQEINNIIQVFEKEVLSKVEQQTNCYAEMEILGSCIQYFVSGYQKKSQDEFEYKKQMLIWEVIDHQLVQEFFNLKPNKSQITSARQIWRATAQQVLFEEQLKILEHRLTSISLSTTMNIFDQTLDNIDTQLTELMDLQNYDASNTFFRDEFEKLQQLKKAIIYQSIGTGQKMIQSLIETIDTEQENFFMKENVDESTTQAEMAMIDGILTRRLHMLVRGRYIAKHKLLTSYKLAPYVNTNIN